MSSEFETFMSTSERFARIQFEKESVDFSMEAEKCPGSTRLIESAFGLRKLYDGNEYEAKRILFEFNSFHSRYSSLLHIMDHNEVMRVPRAMGDLIAEAKYDILDDGRIELIRAEVHDVENNNLYGKPPKRISDTYVVYRLNCQEWTLDGEIFSKFSSLHTICGKPVVERFKRIPFTSIGDFASFFYVLGDNANYDAHSHHRILAGKLDIILKPEKIKEQKNQTIYELWTHLNQKDPS